MKYIIEIWSLGNLLNKLTDKKINLNPPYQRNPIWLKSTQKALIKSIKKGIPIPNIFLHQVGKNKFDMVDGQQRTRAIKLYKETNEINLGEGDEEFKNSSFLTYLLPITIITKVEADESIEDFYYMVNTSGVKLNRPEEFKAHYFDTLYLKLVEKLTQSQKFQSLNIIPINSQKRMMDRELIEEICAQILHGITEKKIQVDKIYKEDIKNEEAEECERQFFKVLDHFLRFNKIKPLKSTRYRQKNDFYTLFGLYLDKSDIYPSILDYTYNTLLIIEEEIRPNEAYPYPLSEYAFNCVSQSNSAKARQIRKNILEELLFNVNEEPSNYQVQIGDFYLEHKLDNFLKKDKFLMFNNEILSEAVEERKTLE